MTPSSYVLAPKENVTLLSQVLLLLLPQPGEHTPWDRTEEVTRPEVSEKGNREVLWAGVRDKSDDGDPRKGILNS
jgi:hypothetical protein